MNADFNDQTPGHDGPDPIESDIRSAFDDLSSRAANPAVAARASLPGRGRPKRPAAGFRYAPSLVAAAVVAVLIAGAALTFGGDDDQPVETGPAETDQVETDEDGPDDLVATPIDDENTSDADQPEDSASDSAEAQEGSQSPPLRTEGSRYRVAMDLVAADASDPYLNMRHAPGADGELLARLPANYTGLEATGQLVEVADGGTWILATLLDPVGVELVEPLHGGLPSGWVNAAFVEFLPSGLPIGTDELGACSGERFIAGQDSGDGGAGVDADWYVYGLESGFVDENCLRIVATFGTGDAPYGGWEIFDEGVGPASSIPSVRVAGSGGFGVGVDLASVTEAAPGATETEHDTFIVRQTDGSLDLISLRPTSGEHVTAFPDRGIVVIDLEISKDNDAGGEAPANGSGVHLTREPLLSRGRVDLVGIARPFEANLGVRVLDEDGNDVEAVFSGSRTWGTVRNSEYSVMTNDWFVWGLFAVRVGGLAAGDYIIELDAEGGADAGEPFRLPVRVESSGPTPKVPTEEEQSAALNLLSFAHDGEREFERLAFADEVTLLLGAGEEQQVRLAAELANRTAWTFDAEHGLGGFSGPFNALDTLQRSVGTVITPGPIDHCAGPPRTWPPAVDGLRQVNIEPVGIDTCLAWFGVSLFLDDGGDIAVVVLDGFGP